jgi:hypothetical protein
MIDFMRCELLIDLRVCNCNISATPGKRRTPVTKGQKSDPKKTNNAAMLVHCIVVQLHYRLCIKILSRDCDIASRPGFPESRRPADATVFLGVFT